MPADLQTPFLSSTQLYMGLYDLHSRGPLASSFLKDSASGRHSRRLEAGRRERGWGIYPSSPPTAQASPLGLPSGSGCILLLQAAAAVGEPSASATASCRLLEDDSQACHHG